MTMGLATIVALLFALLSYGATKSCIVLLEDNCDHHQMLASVLGQDSAHQAMLYRYEKAFNGFAAMIPSEKISALSKLPGVRVVMDDTLYELQTTRSWDFLAHMHGNEMDLGSLWEQSNGGANTLIGMLDTGIWPESESFDDTSYSPVPSGLNVHCENITCNRKLVIARYYAKSHLANGGTVDVLSPRDTEGHGTHTASTAAGSPVQGANYRGFAKGTAKGGAFRARLAIYKCCWQGGKCRAADVLAAFDDGIRDGVDVFSVSLGNPFPVEEPLDPLALGTFQAALNGIVSVAAGGNSGPTPGSVSSVSPWAISVAASTIDRSFLSSVVVENYFSFPGESLSVAKLAGLRPLVTSANVSKQSEDGVFRDQGCSSGMLDPQKTRGKIVLCQTDPANYQEPAKAVKEAGGVGMILCSPQLYGRATVARSFDLPATSLGFEACSSILAHINEVGSDAKALITSPVTTAGLRPAPEIAAFSASGPNLVNPTILKPDIAAPGVNILAAASEYKSSDKFNILSGTSMACPHVTGVVALLKSLYPSWSPSRIKSAIMTTATVMNNAGSLIQDESGKNATPLRYGSGEINPLRAADPGLVYDIDPSDYYVHMCSKMNSTTGSCALQTGRPLELNYPSISVELSRKTSMANISRTLTNVVHAACDYTVTVDSPPGILVSVVPSVLQFEGEGDRQSFRVSFSEVTGGGGRASGKTVSGLGTYAFGSLTWADTVHQVSSPIVVRLK